VEEFVEAESIVVGHFKRQSSNLVTTDVRNTCHDDRHQR